MNVGIFLPNWIGDTVMATPALRAVRRHLAGRGKLIGIMRPYVAEVLSGTHWLDEQLLYDPRDRRPEMRTGSLIGRLRAAELDAALLFTHSWRTAYLAWRSGAKERIGFARQWRGIFLTQRLYHARCQGKYVPSPVLLDYLHVAEAFGCPVESPQLELATLPEDERLANEAWRAFGWSPQEQPILLNGGGAFGEAKHWPLDHFALLARRLAEQHGYKVLMLCGPAERPAVQRWTAQVALPSVKSLADFAPHLGLAKACVRRGRLMVTTDSGPRHFASAFGVPVVTLFGPTHQAWSESFDPTAVKLQLSLPCGPCQQRACPLVHHRCMQELSVEMVEQAAIQLLARQRRQAG